MHRGRVEEQVEKLTKTLRSRESLPSGFYELLKDRAINPDETVLTDLVRDQGCNLVGTLPTFDGQIIAFDIEFDGNPYEE